MSEGVEAELRAFATDRNWDQFHSPENLAKSIAVEAGELLECFQWSDTANRDRVIDELADVLTYCHLPCSKARRRHGRDRAGKAREDA